MNTQKAFSIFAGAVLAVFLFGMISYSDGVSMTGHVTAEDISVCGNLNISNMEYTLTKDISVEEGCFNIIAENVTIDCAGKSISYGNFVEGDYAIYSNYSGTVVKNCNIVQTSPSAIGGASIYFENLLSGEVFGNTISTNGESMSSIHLVGSEKIKIDSNLFNLSGAHSMGVLIDSFSSAVDLESNSFISTAIDVSGVKVVDSDLVSAANNLFNLDGAKALAVGFSNSNANVFTDNSFSLPGGSAKAISAEALTGSEFVGNNLLLEGELGYGIYLISESNENSISGGEVLVTEDSGTPILLSQSNDNSFSGIQVISNGRMSPAITVSGGDNNLFKDLTVETTNSDSHGFFFNDASVNNVIESSSITTYGASSNALRTSYSEQELIVKDSNFSSLEVETYDILFNVVSVIGEIGTFNFTNVMFDSIYWSNPGSGILRENNYFNLQVMDFSGALKDAKVSIENEFNETVYSGTTDSEGKIAENELLKRIRDGLELDISYSNITVLVNYSNSIKTLVASLDNNSLYLINYDVDFHPQVKKSSGGSSSKEKCDADWECAEWSECVDESSFRVCRNVLPECTLGEAPRSEMKCEIQKGINEIKEILFDLNLDIMKDHLKPSEDLLFSIGLINVGVPGKVNASVVYTIFRDGKAIYSENEIVPIETQTEYLKGVDISNLGAGNYVLRADLTYRDQSEPASSEEKFSVEGEVLIKEEKRGTLIAIIVAGVALLAIALVVLILRLKKMISESKRKKAEEFQDYLDAIEKESTSGNKESKSNLYKKIKERYHNSSQSVKKRVYPRIFKMFLEK